MYNKTITKVYKKKSMSNILFFKVDHTRVLDFDIKRRYFRTELERLNEGNYII
jgi:hypothetical protein